MIYSKERHSGIFVVKQKFDFVCWATAKKKLFDESVRRLMRSSFSGLKIKLQFLQKIAVSLDLSFVTFLCVKVKKSKEISDVISNLRNAKKLC